MKYIRINKTLYKPFELSVSYLPQVYSFHEPVASLTFSVPAYQISLAYQTKLKRCNYQ